MKGTKIMFIFTILAKGINHTLEIQNIDFYFNVGSLLISLLFYSFVIYGLRKLFISYKAKAKKTQKKDVR